MSELGPSGGSGGGHSSCREGSCSELTPQRYCLKWNNYAASVTSSFRHILEGEDFVDVSLVSASGVAIKAHRIVLAACSVYFREILKGLSLWQHPVIVLKDVPTDDLRGIIEFIYHGEVSVAQSLLPSLLKSAEVLRVKGLTEEDPPPFRPDDEESSSPAAAAKNTPHVRKNAHPIQLRPPRSGEQDEEDEMEEGHPPCVGSAPGGDEEEIDDAEEEHPLGGSLNKSTIQFPMASSMDTETYSQILNYSKSISASGGGSSSGVGGGVGSSSLTQKKTCPHCYQQLSWHALSRHVRDMHRHVSNYVSCKFCHKIFRNKNSLGCHMWRFHKDSNNKGSDPSSSVLQTTANQSGSNRGGETPGPSEEN